MVDWYDEEYHFWPTDMYETLGEEKWLKGSGSKGSLKLVWFLIKWYQGLKRKRDTHHGFMKVFINLHFFMPTSSLTNLNVCILNQDMLIAGNISLSLENRGNK